MSRDKQVEKKYKIEPINFKIDKTTDEMRKIADEMQKAISNEYRRCVIADERKLEAVLKENGWCKSSELAREIFEEIEEYCEVALMNGHIGTPILCIGHGTFAELKKKYTEGKKDNVD